MIYIQILLISIEQYCKPSFLGVFIQQNNYDFPSTPLNRLYNMITQDTESYRQSSLLTLLDSSCY